LTNGQTRTATIGILTYKRPIGLGRCIDSVQRALARPMPAEWQVAEILVVDNDPAASARSVAQRHGSPHGDDFVDRIPIRYVIESNPGIAAARNRVLNEISTDVLIFIDDDEIAGHGWPQGLMATMSDTGAAMVGGPVHSKFTSPPPAWIEKGRFFERDDPNHASTQDWLRSGNLAIDTTQTKPKGLRFDSRFGQGEDTAFSREAKALGLDLRWSSNGVVTEYVNADRFRARWRLRREYLAHRGWTRSSLDLAPTTTGRLKVRLRVLAASGARLLTGARQLLSGAIRLDRADCVHGLAALVGVVGKTVEVVVYRPPGAGQALSKSSS